MNWGMITRIKWVLRVVTGRPRDLIRDNVVSMDEYRRRKSMRNHPAGRAR